MNKKGQFGIILFFLALLTILIVGFIAAIGVAIIGYTADEAIPILSDLGVVGDTNLTEIGDYTFAKVDILVNSLPWFIGLSYVLALLFSIVFVISMSFDPPKLFIGFYFALMILLIFGGIIMSNMYQDIYEGQDEIGTRLQEQPLISYMILWSPWILTLVSIIAGIFFFVKTGAEGGGFGI